MSELMLEFFDRSTPSETHTVGQAFISIERSGTINFNRAIAEEHALKPDSVVTFGRSGQDWYVAFGSVPGREGFALRAKQENSPALLCSSAVTSRAIIASTIGTAKKMSVRLRLIGEAIQAQGCNWFALELIKPVSLMGGPTVRSVQAEGGDAAPIERVPVKEGDAVPLIRVDKASMETLRGRYSYLYNLTSPSQEQTRELGKVAAEIRRRQSEVKGGEAA
ncbi:hypothetical protein [Hymenobacter pini]|uniref:hypothetical protein n=1 Tax=Hymenobacter pini TaxID=2880879 RepID=UPI001CF5F669|nr:hypothetical protein [Hymenobacter pini]MCA8830559.1 hypothetical protein [Hymenobacter pini]